MKWIFKFLQKKQTKKINAMNKFLIVGLGNIGPQYVNTRHNIGFKILNQYAKKEHIEFQTAKLGDIAQHKLKGNMIFLLKPNTFMNLSGKAIAYWLQKENIPIENLLVITDDLNLSFGTIRIKGKGTDGGHNGLKNTQLLLNTSNYPRFRFGISDQFKKGQQINYVLGEWTNDELSKLDERLQLATEIINSFVLAGLNETMNLYNGK